MKAIHDLLLWVHIPAGTISLILFWIPTLVKKGGKIHRKAGRMYYWSMWIVLASATLLCLTNLMMENYISAIFLGFLVVLTGYPLWYSYEILQQKKEWTDRYFSMRKSFTWLLFSSSVAMVVGAIILKFEGAGILMAFFGALGLPAIKDALMSKEKAMDKEKRLDMHIQGTIVSGIAAYTAFFAFGGSRLFHLPGHLQAIPWILPTVIGVIAMRIVRRKYGFIK